MQTCNGPVDLDSVTIVVDTTTDVVDAMKLGDGCTGRIGRIDVTTLSGDGVNAAPGAHDLDVDGGSIACYGRVGDKHQDGIQAM